MRIELEQTVQESERGFRVHASIYSDPEIFELEMERLFHDNWVYIGHESEIAEPGDYKTAYVGRYPVILSRDGEGDIHVLLNRCMHRGAVVCRDDRGRSNHFRCIYHNWVYENDGTLVGAAQKSGYDENFDRQALSLVAAPKVSSYRGLVFASFNQDVEELEDRLAGVKRYIDAWANRSPAGRLTVPRGSHRYEYPGNWKMQLDNGIDGYHGNYVHESFTKILERSGERSRKEVTRARNEVAEGNHAKGLPRGDALLERRFGMLGTLDLRADERYQSALVEAHGEAAVDDILTQRNILVFPNLYLFESHIRVIRPVRHDLTIVDNYPTWLEGVADEVNTARLREHERFFGPASFGATDDLEIFVQVQTGLAAEGAEWFDLSRGLHREEVRDGEHIGHSTDESTQRAVYREWLRGMTRGS